MKRQTVDPIDACVGARLKKLRLRGKLRLVDAGEAVGVTHTQVDKYERGQNRVSTEKMKKFAKFYSVTVAYFYKGAFK